MDTTENLQMLITLVLLVLFGREAWKLIRQYRDCERAVHYSFLRILLRETERVVRKGSAGVPVWAPTRESLKTTYLRSDIACACTQPLGLEQETEHEPPKRIVAGNVTNPRNSLLTHPAWGGAPITSFSFKFGEDIMKLRGGETKQGIYYELLGYGKDEEPLRVLRGVVAEAMFREEGAGSSVFHQILDVDRSSFAMETTH